MHPPPPSRLLAGHLADSAGPRAHCTPHAAWHVRSCGEAHEVTPSSADPAPLSRRAEGECPENGVTGQIVPSGKGATVRPESQGRAPIRAVCPGQTGSSKCIVSMQSVFGDADVPIVVELAQKPDLQGVPRGRARDADRSAAAVPRRLGAAGTGDRGLQRVLRLDPGSATRAVIAENDPAEQESRSNGTRCCAT